MWSTVVMFVLTFAVLGLLLGIAETFNSSSEPDSQVPAGPEEVGGANAASNASANQSSGAAS